MTTTDGELFSSLARRRLVMSASSGGNGLKPTDILRKGLAEQNPQLSALTTPQESLAERIFNALADAKIWTSKVAMHLDLKSRDRYFRQLDLLHDAEEWLGDESPVRLESYKSFIRLMLTIGHDSKPSLALSSHGNLLAVWQSDVNRLTVEFLPDGFVEWSVVRRAGERTEQFAGNNARENLMEVLSGLRPEVWFG